MATDPVAALELFSELEVQHFERITADLTSLRGQLEGLTIRNAEDAAKVHNGLSEVKRFTLDIDRIRKAQVGPLNDQVKAINAAWRPLNDILLVLETTAKKKILAFQQAERERIAREQAEARRKQEEAQRREQEALAKAAAAKSSKAREKALEAANAAGQDLMAARVAEPMDAPTGIRTDHGTTSTRMRWTFQITEPSLVPREYLVVDDKAIRRAVLAGQRSIAGVHIYEEEELATRVS